MEKLVNALSAKLTALEKEGKNNTDLEARLMESVRNYQRGKMIDEIKSELNMLAIRVNMRARQLEFFIYAVKENAVQGLVFHFISSAEIELYYDTNPERMELIETESRITLYTEFQTRSLKLLEKIKLGGLDQYLNQSPKDILFMIMGYEGELLEKNAEDKTTIRLAEISALVEYRRLRFLQSLRGSTPNE